MKIVMFSNTYLPMVGGIEKSIDIFARRMRELGHPVLVVAPEYDEARESSAEVLRVPAIRHVAGSPFSINLALPARDIERIGEFSPDIVHSHQPFLLGDSALRLARTRGIPIVYTNHTFMERYLHWFPVDWQVLRDIAEGLPVRYANLVDHVITPTDSVAQVLRERGATTPITSIPTGIDAAFFGSGDRTVLRRRHGLADDCQLIGHLGRLGPEKNLSYLKQVAVAFVAQAPERRAFLLVGDGESVAEIQQAFAEAGLADRLIYAGLLHGKACADAYAAMDAFLFTSLTDTQGLVLSEAMAAGNAVFALDAPGARDLIRDGATGALFDPQTAPTDFAARMSALMDDPTRYPALREAAFESAQMVSIPRCTDAMLDLYRAVIAQHRRDAESLTTWDKLKALWDVEVELMQEKLGLLVG